MIDFLVVVGLATLALDLVPAVALWLLLRGERRRKAEHAVLMAEPRPRIVEDRIAARGGV